MSAENFGPLEIAAISCQMNTEKIGQAYRIQFWMNVWVTADILRDITTRCFREKGGFALILFFSAEASFNSILWYLILVDEGRELCVERRISFSLQNEKWNRKSYQQKYIKYLFTSTVYCSLRFCCCLNLNFIYIFLSFSPLLCLFIGKKRQLDK